MLNLLPKYLENRTEPKIMVIGTLAGAEEISITVPANKIWIPLSLYLIFTASAVVATRSVRIYYKRGANFITRTSSQATITAGTQFVLPFVHNNSYQTSATTAIPNLLPVIPLVEGDILLSSTGSMQAGDVYSNVVFSYLEADTSQPA